MQLKEIKLAGFKSFVDPTKVPLPSNLLAVVGPNGCGKSNIIDAVRWVMGESSAKHLRGESMTDVIFNGSTGRKPVGQASVELIFDNSDGAVGGEYAKYSEISVKRLVTRDGQSNYYLNNNRCRRKDITDIFLGTGLGPRSYSIIEQGMISRVIEAKPEELRIYLEEAAGISKYKERRRETENRIRHTRENLERLNDIRDELGKQLERLNRQARSAEKYKEYREEERLLKAQLLALRWHAMHSQLEHQQSLIREQEVQLESFIADQRRFDKNIELKRVEHTDATDNFNAVQAEYYRIGAEIARLEEAIQHQRDRKQQLENDLAQAQADFAAAEEHFESDQLEIAELDTIITQLEPEVEMHTAQIEVAQESLTAIEEERAEWQMTWDEFNLSSAESSKLAHVEQTRIQHLESRMQSIMVRMQKLQEEQSQQNFVELQEEIETTQLQQAELAAKHDECEDQLVSIANQLSAQRDSIAQTNENLDAKRNHLQSLRGRHASLEALQQAALGKQSGAVMEWLEHNQLADNARLAQDLKVESGWETAVETVLGDYLQAVCADDLQTTLSVIDSLPGSLTFIDTHAAVNANTDSSKATPLTTKVTTRWVAAESRLAHVFVAEDLQTAYGIAKTLAAHESVITKDGIWLGNGWLRVARDNDEKAGVLARETELNALTDDIEKTQSQVNELQEQLAAQRENLQTLEAERDDQQQQLNRVKSEQSDANAVLRVKQNNYDQLTKRAGEIDEEIVEQQAQRETCQQEIEEARASWQTAMTAMDNNADIRQELIEKRDDISQRLDNYREQVKAHRDSLHESELKLQSSKTHRHSLMQNCERMRDRMQDLEVRRESLAMAMQKSENPDDDFAERLNIKLALHKDVEAKLQEARRTVENLEHAIRQDEEARGKADQNARGVQSRLEQLRMDGQGHAVRKTTIEEQLAETNYALKDLLDNMPEDAEEKAWEASLEQIAGRIQRLGPINLAAIEEFKSESERKEYLDSQNDDLIEALTTLESAISKIDKETRARFKETYEIVNTKFQELFPRLFGGGQAYLELTGEDLLDTGVSVIARPPGKRNSSIHLLSGGEKAMTAVALVFSIFHLNPSPFCMLDEVDAPLDDANVSRFCKMVEAMSKSTQFIFITHNKVTMELANHLIGVTMHEPGVSRMVAVDVEEAVSLAEA